MAYSFNSWGCSTNFFNPIAKLVIPIGIPTKEAKAETKTHPVTAEAEISKLSIWIKTVPTFLWILPLAKSWSVRGASHQPVKRVLFVKRICPVHLVDRFGWVSWRGGQRKMFCAAIGKGNISRVSPELL